MFLRPAVVSLSKTITALPFSTLTVLVPIVTSPSASAGKITVTVELPPTTVSEAITIKSYLDTLFT